MSEASSNKYDYNRFGSKGQRVGQAVFDIISHYQPMQTVGETLDAFGPDYAKQMEECIEDNEHKYTNPFYIFVLTKKEFFANNVLRNYFIARQTPPHAFDMMEQYSNYTKTLYIIDANRGNIKCLWTLPGFDDCITIARNPANYDPDLVKWVEDCFSKKLDKDSYGFDD
jgi:hypothetical protein